MILASSTYNMFAKPLTAALSPLSLLFLSELITLSFLLMSFGLVPIVERLMSLPPRKFLPLLWVGILSGTIAPTMWFSGLHATTAVNANLFGNAEMVFLILLAIFVLGERWTVGHAIASISIALGIFIVALRGFTEGISIQFGDMLIILASLSFSLGSITFRKYLHHVEPQVAIFVRSITAISAFLLLHVIRSMGEGAPPLFDHELIAELRSFPISLIPALLGFCFIARFCNVLTFYVALDRLPVATVSLLGSLTVVTGTLFAHWYLDEPILWYHAFGGSLIILGSIILETLGLHPSEKHHTAHLEQKLHRA